MLVKTQESSGFQPSLLCFCRGTQLSRSRAQPTAREEEGPALTGLGYCLKSDLPSVETEEVLPLSVSANWKDHFHHRKASKVLLATHVPGQMGRLALDGATSKAPNSC